MFARIPGIALVLLVCLAVFSGRAAAAVFDDFESYAVASNLHGLGGWAGWGGNASAGALVSSAFAFSPIRSVNITGASDLVHTFSGATNGQWVFSVRQYIPSTSTGTNYVVLMNTYRPPYGPTDLNWSVIIQNNMNSGQIISDLGGSATRPMVKDQWVEVRCEINLDANSVSEFYNGQLLSTHAWRSGAGLNEIQALDLFANNAAPVYYDNVSLGLRNQVDDTLHLDIARTNSNVVLTWTNAAATLESTLVLPGAWSEVTGAVSPRVIPPTNLASFFRLRATNTPASFDFRYAAPTFTTSIGDPFGCGCTSPENPNSLAAGGGAQDNGMGSVLLNTGELTQDAVDLEIPGRGFNWRFELRYRSGMSYDGPAGQGWDFNYNRRLTVETNGNVLCMNGLGRADRYTFNTNGTFNSPAGLYTQLKRNLDGTLEERDRHGTTNYYSATNSLGVARLSRISDRSANQMTFQYNAAGQLTTVVDTLAHSIAYRYDPNGRLTNVTDFAGRALSFAYDSNGNLASTTSPAVTGTPNGNDFPSGKTTLYTYSSGFADDRFNHNLLSITAPNEAAVGGPARLLAQYDTNPLSTNAARLVSLRLGGTNATGVPAGGTISFTYASFGAVSSNDYATPVFQNTVTNRNGDVAQYQFNQLGNIVRSIQFTRGLRVGEPAGYTNIFAFNRDGEMIARTNAELDSVQYTFDSANPDRLQQGNLLQIRSQPGPRGGDQAQIVVINSYETNFNFIAASSDGRNNTTSFRYDSHGNRTNVMNRIASIVEDFEYSNGQMTAHVLPNNGIQRRRDVMTYYSSGPQMGYLQQSIVDSGGFNLTTTYEYDAAGNLTRMIDPRSNDTLYVVNQLNQIVRTSSAAISTTNGLVRYQRSFFYDANNSLIHTDIQNIDDGGHIVASLPNFTTTKVYDILGSPLSMAQQVTTNHSVTTEYRYDAAGNRTLTRSGVATSGLQTNNVVGMQFDERGLAFKEIRAPGDPGHSTTQWDYDKNGNLVRTLHGLEDTPHAMVQTFDGYNRRVTSTDAMSNVRTFYYDANSNVVSNRVDGELVDVPGGAGNVRLSTTSFTLDAMDRVIRTDTAWFDPQTQAPIGGGQVTSQTAYSDNSQALAVIDENNHTNRTSYDTANRPFIRTDPKGDTVTYIYDANGNVTLTTQVDKSDLGGPNQTFTTTAAYDQLNRQVATSDNQTNLIQFAYDSLNNRTLLTDARGNQTRYDFDGLNRLLATRVDMNANGVFTDTVDIVTSQTWDDSSRLTGQTDDNTNTTAYAYDALNRESQITYADGTTNNYTYNVHDNRLTARDANGSVVTTSYDQLDRALINLVARAAGVLGTANELYQYDGLARLVRATNNHSTVTFAYDSLAHLTTESQQLAGSPARTITAAFDSHGNRTNLVYPGGRSIALAYDTLNLLATVKDTTPPAATITQTASTGFTFLVGPPFTNSIQVTLTNAFSSFNPSLGTLLGVVYTGNFGVDSAGTLSPTNGSGSFTMTGSGSFNDHLATTFNVGAAAGFGFSPAGGYSFSVGGGSPIGSRPAGSLANYIGNFTFSPTVTLNPLTFSVTAGYTVSPSNEDSHLDLTLTYTYTPAPSTLAAHSRVGDRLEQRVLGNGTRTLYTYDGLGGVPNGTNDFGVGRFARITHTNFTTGGLIDDRKFSWDRNGSKASTEDLLLSQTRAYAYDATKQLVTSVVLPGGPTNVYNLDGVGNRTSVVSNGVTGTYTMGNSLPQPADFQMNQYTLTPGPVTNSYDLNGNRTSVTGQSQSAYDFRNRLVRHISAVPAQTNTYRYDCLGRRLEKVAGANLTNLVRIYYSGWQEIENQNSADTTQATFVWGDYIDDLLTMTRSNLQYYFHSDDLHSVRKATDASGSVAEQYDYADFGSPSFFNGAGASISNSAIGNPHLFTGLRYETETGLYYSRMRDLDYLAGRFTTRDPLGIWRDLYNMGNGYTYVGNGPMSATDPMGTTTVTYIGNFPCGTGWPAGCYRMCFQYDTPTESYIGCFLRNVSSSLAVQWPPSGGGLGVGNTYPGAGTGSTLVAEGANDPLVGVGVGLGHICRDAQNNIIPCNSGLAITINNYRSNVKDNSPYQGPSSGGDPGVGPIYSADPIAGQAVQQERMTVPGSNRCVCSKGISGS